MIIKLVSRFLSYMLVGMVKLYQIFLSPYFGKNCRYLPTCSAYMIEAIQVWGPIKGTYLGIKRLLKCNPFGGHGHDPVPKKGNK